MFNKPPIYPIKDHPRLFLTAKDLPVLREKLEHAEMQPIWQKLQSFSRVEPDEIYAHHHPEPAFVIEANALLYLLNDDQAAGEKAKALALNCVTQRFNPNYQDISREIGRLMLAGAIVYDWCHDLLSEEDKQFLIEQFKRLATLLECGYPPVNEGAFVGHTSEWMLMRDLIGTGIAIYNEDPEMYELAAGRFFEQFVPARNFFYPSGWHHQGDGYGGVRFQTELYPTWMFARMGFGNVFDETQERVGYQWIYSRRPDGKLFHDGDSTPNFPRGGKYKRLSFIYSLLGSYFQNPYFRDQYLREDVIVQDRDLLFVFLFHDPNLERKSIAELPLTRYFGEPAGIMVARTGWDEEHTKTSGTVVAEMKVSMYQYNNHQHLDAGAFQIYYKGLLALDSGTYKGSSGKYQSPHNKYYYKRTIAHNCLLVYDPEELKAYPEIRDGGLTWPNVNDGGQRWPNHGRPPMTIDELLNGEFKRAEVKGHAIGPCPNEPDYSYLKGNLAPAYSNKVKQYERSFVFLNFKNKAHPAALIVYDRVVSSDSSFTKHWLLHSIHEPEINENRTIITQNKDGYHGQLINDTLLPKADETLIEKIGGPDQQYWVFGTNYRSDFPDGIDQGEWRIEVRPKQPSKLDYFLNVLQVRDADGQAEPLSSTLHETENLLGASIHDWIVYFSKNEGRIRDSLHIPVQGAGQAQQILMTDLCAGTWVAEYGGQRYEHEVSEEGGVLHFENVTGPIQLTHSPK